MEDKNPDLDKSNNTSKVKKEKAEAVQKLAENLIKDEKNLDFGSIFKMANKLMKDETLKDLMEEIRKNPEEQVTEAERTVDGSAGEKIENGDIAVLIKEMEALKSELKNTQNEVAELKMQNASLLSLYLKVVSAASNDFKKGVGLITGLSKFLK
ncbi:hypothetical protein J7I93_13880 [Bacillus sp. ISL-47]|uniref:hypothetical protein n=1 Tax=Bacillus sp. ISL-47 TaxID=2819130 RepID=UPI001BE65D29|nr:hypothetical protein [Bacillus sp. ISL-47]MBT2689277.1 hypothetical protein [Bacillus sp. ISL-47]MBT2707168.1 hypothetical protein [Pseudomonas sp. ISL-84]